MDSNELERIKKLAIIAMVSDDELMEKIVLKGGNAIDLLHKIAGRASLDLDFSMEDEFKQSEQDALQAKVEKLLTDAFEKYDYHVFDVTFAERPKHVRADIRSFWGGYRIEFKVMQLHKLKNLSRDISALRRNVLTFDSEQRRRFRIEISKFEYCQPKTPLELEGFTVYVYSPLMIVIEKLRAICQQMPEYAKIIGTKTSSARARDFFDIYTICQHYPINLTDDNCAELIRQMFEAKRVPIQWIDRIRHTREYHRPDFVAVQNTVKHGVGLKEFDYYFEYVVNLCSPLKPLWEM